MSAPSHVIVLIHGIRTEAAWAEMVQSVLQNEAAVVVEPLRYGYFDLLRFVCPLITRSAAVREIHQKLQAVRHYNRDSEVSVIAHSFGTHIITAILKKDSFISIKRLILCGSVVHRRYPWADVAHKVLAPKVLNDCGTDDIYPVLARCMTFGYGPTGTFGFGDPKVRDRFHRITHGDYFNEEFVREYWVPYLRDGTIQGTPWEKQRTTPPWWMSLLAILPIRWIVWVFPLVWIGYTLWQTFDSAA